MAYVLRVIQKDGTWAEIPALVGPRGHQGDKGEQGQKGEKGDPFAIAKTYPSVEAMNSGYSTDGVAIGSFVVIDTGNIADEENARLYFKGETAYVYLTDLSGATGLKGDPGEKGDPGDPGEKGDTGYSGVHVGSSTPPTGANVWISDTEEYNGAEEWEFQMADGSVVKKVMLIPAEGEALRAFRVRKEDGSWQDVPMLMSEVGSGGGSVDNSNILHPVDGYLIGGPNLVDDVRTLKVNGEADESNLIKFKGAPRAVEPGELVGRWVLINGRRAYVGTNTVDTLVLFTDSTKSETLDITCPSGTIIYPADINAEGVNGINIRSLAAKIPTVTAADEGKFLRVVNGAWAKVALTDVSQEGG